MEKITFSIDARPEIILKADHLCHNTYLRMGYISKALPGFVMSNNEQNANYIVAANSYGSVVGTLRLSQKIPADIFKVWKGKLYGSCFSLVSEALSRRSFSIGSLAVDKAYAGMKISWGLYQMAYKWALSQNMEYGIITIDHHAFRALKMVGWHAVQVGEAALYLGSPTIPAIIPIRQQTCGAVNEIKPQFNHYTT